MNKPELSIIIPTYNRRERLVQVLSSLEAQTYPLEKLEVIVISDGSTDGTDAFLEEHRTAYELRPVFQQNQGVAVARNTGLDQAKADWILFLDDDVRPAPELVSEHIACLKSNDKAVVLGPMLMPKDVRLLPWVRWEQLMLDKQYNHMLMGKWKPTARQFYTGNTSLEKQYILQAGGFDPSFFRAEDVELAYRLKDLGMRFIFNPNAVVYHYAERSFKTWIKIAYTYGENDVLMSFEKKQHWLLPQIRTEYYERNFVVRGLTRMCLGRDELQGPAIEVLKGVALAADRINFHRLARYCFSGIYNLRYYQGIADHLGGRNAFFEYMDDRRLSSSKNESF